MKKGEKILFINFNCNWCPHFETDLEIMLNLIKEGYDLYSLSCDGIMNPYCISSYDCYQENKCKQCIETKKNGFSLINLSLFKRLTLKPSKKQLVFPEFSSIEQLKNYKINNINIGFGAASSFMARTRDCFFNPSKNKHEINKLLHISYLIYENVDKLIKKLKPKRIYLLNGRFAEYFSVVELCKLYNIDFYIHERGCNNTKYQLIKNDILHRLERFHEEINAQWLAEKDYSTKTKLAENWFNERRNRIEQGWISFVKNQTQNRLPDNFNLSKENIVIFNSSMDEYALFDDWQSPIDNNQNNIIENILLHYSKNPRKHFYLRVHPNLKNVESSQMEEIKTFQKKYNNLTVIWSDDKVDSYALLDNCKKSIVFISTMGIEATFWGKPSILAGKSLYDNLDCVYQATNYKTLFKLIDSNLKPKPKENCYPYAYWQSTYGIPFKYFEPEGLFNGRFKGINLRKKRNALQRAFKRLEQSAIEFILNH